jgi:hypothetical protein
MSDRKRAHWEGCWHDHHDCAVAEIRRLLGECCRLTNYLTEDEARALIHSALAARGGGELSESEARLLIAWGNKVRKLAATLEGVLKGYLSIDVVDGDLRLIAKDRGAALVEAVATGHIRVVHPSERSPHSSGPAC